jgi:hypothetical protein
MNLYRIRYQFRDPYSGKVRKAKTLWWAKSPREAVDKFTEKNPHILSCHVEA